MQKDKYHIAVDLDGTLALYDHGKYDPDKIGLPIPKMVARVKNWLKMGYKVSIFTARMSPCRPIEERLKTFQLIKDWCREYIGQELDAVCEKNPDMNEFWDDKAIGVIHNTGEIAVFKEDDNFDEDGIGRFLAS